LYMSSVSFMCVWKFGRSFFVSFFLLHLLLFLLFYSFLSFPY
jgi:hypothetical protein